MVPARRFAVATQPALQDGIAKELREAGMLAHGEDREPALPSHADLEKLPYLMSVRAPCQLHYPPGMAPETWRCDSIMVLCHRAPWLLLPAAVDCVIVHVD